MKLYTIETVDHGTIRRLQVQAKPADEGELAGPDEWARYLVRLQTRMAMHGVLPPEDPWLSRVDVAVDVRYPEPTDGKAVLDALRTVRLKHGMHVQTYGQPVTTVAFKLRSKTRARAYCRNSHPKVKTETGPMYGMLRLETQALFKPRQMKVEYLDEPRFGAMMWEGQYGALDGRVVRIAREVQAMKLVERLQLGEIGYAQAERMMAYLDFERLGVAERVYKPGTLRERRREARELGLSANDAEYEPVELDLGELLHPFQKSWAEVA